MPVSPSHLWLLWNPNHSAISRALDERSFCKLTFQLSLPQTACNLSDRQNFADVCRTLAPWYISMNYYSLSVAPFSKQYKIVMMTSHHLPIWISHYLRLATALNLTQLFLSGFPCPVPPVSQVFSYHPGFLTRFSPCIQHHSHAVISQYLSLFTSQASVSSVLVALLQTAEALHVRTE